MSCARWVHPRTPTLKLYILNSSEENEAASRSNTTLSLPCLPAMLGRGCKAWRARKGVCRGAFRCPAALESQGKNGCQVRPWPLWRGAGARCPTQSILASCLPALSLRVAASRLLRRAAACARSTVPCCRRRCRFRQMGQHAHEQRSQNTRAAWNAACPACHAGARTHASTPPPPPTRVRAKLSHQPLCCTL